MTSREARQQAQIAAAGQRTTIRRLLGGIKPRRRSRELGLLVLVGVALVVGALSLGTQVEAGAGRTGLRVADPGLLAIYLTVLAMAHVAQVLTGRRTDEILLPTIGMLGGIGLLLMERLPQQLVQQHLLGRTLGLASLQLVWLVLALVVLTSLAIIVRSDSWLRRYKYSWAALGVGLLLVLLVFGRVVNGARLDVQVGPLSGQPSELLKIVLVVFLAGYLSENRSLLAEQSTRLGPISLPPLPYLLPMVAMWGTALGLVVLARELGVALLFFSVFLLLLYVATSRLSYVLVGSLAFLAGSAVLYGVFDYVKARVDIWIDPFRFASDAGYQVVQALYAFARGGILGTGLGAGLPLVGGHLPVPAIQTDFPLAALGEELGLLGVLAILGLYLVLVERGLRIAAAAADDFRALLATGLSLVVGVQALVIAGGNLKVIPLTGVPLPFISYGGSSLVANAIVVGLLLALSDRGVELPVPAQHGRRASRWFQRRR